ncbi:MAG: hypothetical protein HFE63_08555 [Clostridiales bacterium]|nr:hypothetical protein [Clostridiales bacterium]
MNDAIYDRNTKIAERFNVNLNILSLTDDSNLWNTALQNDVMSNSGEYDVVMPDYWWGCETKGLFLNMLDYDVLELDQPWWCAGWNDNATVYGQLYNAVGSLVLDTISNLEVIFFNKELIDSLNLEDPYKLVNDHKWTIDKLNEMADAALADLNGDQTYSLETDRLGYSFGLHAGRAILVSAGMQLATTTADGSYEYNFINDRFISMHERVYKLINETESVHYSTSGEEVQAFMNDRLLFLGGALELTDALREMASDYGIVPCPMFNEQQENYITASLGVIYMAIPLSAKDPEMSAVMLEALNAESYKSVNEAYYNVALKGKYSRDDETGIMLDLISNSAFFDFTFVNEAATGYIVREPFEWIENKRPNIISNYEGKKAMYEQKLEDLMKTYAENIK